MYLTEGIVKKNGIPALQDNKPHLSGIRQTQGSKRLISNASEAKNAAKTICTEVSFRSSTYAGSLIN